MPETRVRDEQGNIHVFPDGATPGMIAQALNVKPPTLAQAVKAKYPEYNDMDDYTLEQKVLAKYPEYGDLPLTPKPQLQQPTATVSAAPTGVLPWLRNAEGDLRFGTQTTGLGQFFHKLGYTGGETPYDYGHSNAIGRIAESVPVGLSELAQGAVNDFQGAWRNNPRQLWEGTKKGVEGASNVAAIPSMVATPDAAEAAASAPSLIRRLLSGAGLKASAGESFNAARAVAGANPVDVEGAGQAALGAQELQQVGRTMPRVMTRFLQRVTTPGAPELTYDEARKFYSAAGELSANDSAAITDAMRRQLNQFKEQLGDAIQDTADRAGVGTEYGSAMKDYAKAKRLQDNWQWVWTQTKKNLVPALIRGAGIGAGGTLVYKALNDR